jgi:acyl carrier protein
VVNNSDLREELTILLREILKQDDIILNDDTTAADFPGWDSLTHVKFIVIVEEKYGIRFSHLEVLDLKTHKDFENLLVEKIRNLEIPD